MDAAIAYAREHRGRFLDDLREFLRIPSVSTAPERAGDVARAAQWIASQLDALGFATRVDPTERHPIVRADWLQAPGAPTVLCYAHYDVQPPEPLELWRHPPFDPTLEDSVLYARGASDDKGGVLILVKAMESILKTAGALPVNVKFSPDAPPVRAAARALESVYGKPPVYVRVGGSIPIVAGLTQTLKIPPVIMGFGLPDDNFHAPNEKFNLSSFHRGIDTVIRFLHQFRG